MADSSNCQPSSKAKQRNLPFLMQWNCASLHLRHAELSLFLKCSRIPILAFSEAGLPKDQSISGYYCYRNPTMTGFPNGSAALFIRKAVPQLQIDTTDLCTEDLEIIAARVKFNNQILCVVTVYVRVGKGRIKVADCVKEICQRCEDPILMCGDWNAHHGLWGANRDDTCGRALVRAFEECNLAVANDGSPTLFRPPDIYSAITSLSTLQACV